jgi:DNA topoisomerase-2
MKVQEFFNNEFIHFSIYDCQRSIPSVIDGFKISQRKCIYGLIKRGENAGEAKVAQLSGSIASVSNYHHGEDSLNTTLVGMARNYAGSNNLNYLIPSGQFGSRLDKESAAPRYIFTEFSPDFRKIFKKDDDIILEYLMDDGEQIEPKFYVPILPNVLINGATGVGTGFASTILNYNPEYLRKNILSLLDTKFTSVELLPWYRGFKGQIVKDESKFIVTGCYEIVAPNKIHITELPIGVFNDGYKKVLFKLQDDGFIKDFKNTSTEESFDFLITTVKPIDKLTHEEIVKKFKLETSQSQNLTLWDENGKIKVFENVNQIVKHFVDFRLQKYDERRIKQLELLTADLNWSIEKQRFIQFYIENSKMFSSKSKKELESMLMFEGFEFVDRLMDIRIYNLTKDDIDKLNTSIDKLNKEIAGLNKMTAVKMYIKELEELKL